VLQHSFYCMLSTVCPRCLSSLIRHLLVCTKATSTGTPRPTSSGTPRSCNVHKVTWPWCAWAARPRLGLFGPALCVRSKGRDFDVNCCFIMWLCSCLSTRMTIRGAANTYHQEIGRAFLAYASCVIHFTCVCVLECVSTNVRVWCAPVYAHECIVCA